MSQHADSRAAVRREHDIEWWQDAQGVGHIVIDRPARANAVGLHQARALALAIEETVAAAPRVIRLGGRGPIFCAGGDIQEFVAAGEQLPQLVADILDPLLPAFVKLASAPCPVVTVIGGSVGGAGIGLGLAGDFVLASSSLKLRTGYAAIGLSPDIGASYFLARRIGALKAQRWLMMSQPLTAEQCLAAGAVDELHAPEALDAAADALIQQLCQAAPASLAAIKRLCGVAGRLDVAAHGALERELLEACSHTADGREGVRAFVEKRLPRFSGR